MNIILWGIWLVVGRRSAVEPYIPLPCDGGGGFAVDPAYKENRSISL